MGDMADVWVGFKERSREKRASNRANSAQTLRTFGIGFTSHNSGAHLIVKHGEKIIDFWPGTGKWFVRGQSDGKRGVMNLVKFCQKGIKEKPAQQDVCSHCYGIGYDASGYACSCTQEAA